MQDFIYTAQGIVTKSDILESFVSNSGIIDGEDLYGRAGVIVFDESVRGKCNFRTCAIRKPEQTCSGIKREIVDEFGNKIAQDPAHYDLGMSTCPMTCTATKNNTPDAMGCLCQPTAKDPKNIRCQSKTINIAFPDNRKPCLRWDATTNQLKVNTSITGCKPTTEGFEQDEQEDPLLPFFDQRMFRPSWSVGK